MGSARHEYKPGIDPPPNVRKVFDALKDDKVSKVLEAGGTTLLVSENSVAGIVTVETTARSKQHASVADAMREVGESLKAQGVSCTLDDALVRCGGCDQTISLKCPTPRSR